MLTKPSAALRVAGGRQIDSMAFASPTADAIIHDRDSLMHVALEFKRKEMRL
jgi:hypothetical protein